MATGIELTLSSHHAPSQEIHRPSPFRHRRCRPPIGSRIELWPSQLEVPLQPDRRIHCRMQQLLLGSSDPLKDTYDGSCNTRSCGVPLNAVKLYVVRIQDMP